MTGTIATTVSGLSEGIFWDFKDNCVSSDLMDYYGFSKEMIPDICPTFGVQGTLTAAVATELGLKKGTPVTYRAGDQPNNALSLNVLNPGEIAATGGTSGVVYGVNDKINYDNRSRVNIFAHDAFLCVIPFAEQVQTSQNHLIERKILNLKIRIQHTAAI